MILWIEDFMAPLEQIFSQVNAEGRIQIRIVDEVL